MGRWWCFCILRPDVNNGPVTETSCTLESHAGNRPTCVWTYLISAPPHPIHLSSSACSSTAHFARLLSSNTRRRESTEYWRDAGHTKRRNRGQTKQKAKKPTEKEIGGGATILLHSVNRLNFMRLLDLGSCSKIPTPIPAPSFLPLLLLSPFALSLSAFTSSSRVPARHHHHHHHLRSAPPRPRRRRQPPPPPSPPPPHLHHLTSTTITTTTTTITTAMETSDDRRAPYASSPQPLAHWAYAPLPTNYAPPPHHATSAREYSAFEFGLSSLVPGPAPQPHPPPPPPPSFDHPGDVVMQNPQAQPPSHTHPHHLSQQQPQHDHHPDHRAPPPQLHPLVMPLPWPSLLQQQPPSVSTAFPPPYVSQLPYAPASAPPAPGPGSGHQLHTPVSATSARSSGPRRTLTDNDRRRMCRYAEENPHSKQTEIGGAFAPLP